MEVDQENIQPSTPAIIWFHLIKNCNTTIENETVKISKIVSSIKAIKIRPKTEATFSELWN